MFKSKINPEELSKKTYKEYVALLKKETKKAENAGLSNAVTLSDFKFACGTVATLLIVGKFSGPLAQWYKKMRKERTAEKDFAMGDCFFEMQQNGSIQLHIALKEGKGKPNQMIKNGKKMFQKLGYIPNIFRGELPATLLSTQKEATAEQTQAKQGEEKKEQTDDSNIVKSLTQSSKQYSEALPKIAKEVMPRIKNSPATVDATHLELVQNTLTASRQFLAQYETLQDNESKARFAKAKEKMQGRQSDLQKIETRLKTLLGQTDESIKQGTEKAKTEMYAQLEILKKFFDQSEK